VTGVGGRLEVAGKTNGIIPLHCDGYSLKQEGRSLHADQSCMADEIRLPMSRMKDWPSAQMESKVSVAMVANIWRCISGAYLE
jgi:hypothetical protein